MPVQLTDEQFQTLRNDLKSALVDTLKTASEEDQIDEEIIEQVGEEAADELLNELEKGDGASDESVGQFIDDEEKFVNLMSKAYTKAFEAQKAKAQKQAKLGDKIRQRGLKDTKGEYLRDKHGTVGNVPHIQVEEMEKYRHISAQEGALAV